MILLIDNYDSFTYNLLHYMAELGAEVKVVRNDTLNIAQIEAMQPQGIVISPGPATPDDAGISLEIVSSLSGKIPLFGVCLGHQSMGQAFGGNIIRTHPMHGKISAITHTGHRMFEGIPSPFNATRYHSLIIEKASLPDCYEITAETEDGTIMGIAHTEHLTWGVQFHPESIASEHGHTLLSNFLKQL
jgi:anthranilate synthase/aminodeoxychorismate synthase-like glutamine amidotransferase